jgi:hypothetical protein
LFALHVIEQLLKSLSGVLGAGFAPWVALVMLHDRREIWMRSQLVRCEYWRTVS